MAEAALLLSVGLVLQGCSLSPRPDPTRFFDLSSIGEVAEAERAASPLDVRVGVGPIRLPDHIDRPQLVTRIGPNELQISQNDRWAAPLRDDIVRTLAENIALLLGTERVRTYPWFGSWTPAYTVEVDFLRFESDTTGRAQLTAGWRIRAGASGERLHADRAEIRRAAAGPGAEAAVAAQSEALAELSSRLVEAIRELHEEG